MGDLRVNDAIRAREVRLVAPDGKQIGVRPIADAMAAAREARLDLVEVAPSASPPVCRVMDYGKHKYEESLRAKASRRKAARTILKEMKYRPRIGEADYQTKTSKVLEFLEAGCKVKVTIMFRGREQAHPDLGTQILDRVASDAAAVGKVDQSPKRAGRDMTMVLSPLGSGHKGGHKTRQAPTR